MSCDAELVDPAAAGPFDAMARAYASRLPGTTSIEHLSETSRANLVSNTLFRAITAPGPGGETTSASPTAGKASAGAKPGTRRHHRGRDAAAAPRIEANLRLVAERLDFDDVQRAVFRFLATCAATPALEGLCDELFGPLSNHSLWALFARATGFSPQQVAAACRPTGRLQACGLVEIDACRTYTLSDKVTLRGEVLDVLEAPRLRASDLVASFLPSAEPASLRWSDFRHLGASLGDLRALLSGACARGRAGVHVLFYGATGTGKTELASLVAARLGRPLWTAAHTEDGDHPLTGLRRLKSWVLAGQLVAPGDGLLLFDEMEDVFADEGRFGDTGMAGNKKYFTRLLESSPVPTIWTTNSVADVDVAFLRRFSYAVEFPPLSAPVRAAILGRLLGRTRRLSPPQLDALVREVPAGPGQLASAVRATALMGACRRRDPSALRRVLAPISRLVQGERSAQVTASTPPSFRPELSSASCDLAALAAKLVDRRRGRGDEHGVTLCLHGPPGTGKSAFVAHLAARLGRPLLRRDVHQLLGCYVGETEAAIAAAFAEARERDAVLLFDEADAFLGDRARARNRWEVTATNTFLQRLEACSGIVACTTNRLEDLDRAALRRFVLVVEFFALTQTQKKALLADLLTDPRAALSAASAGDTVISRAADLLRDVTLAPGDFVAVGRRARIEGPLPVQELLLLLRRQPHGRARSLQPMGFSSGQR